MNTGKSSQNTYTTPKPTLRQLLVQITADAFDDVTTAGKHQVKRAAFRAAAYMLDDALDYLIELTDTGWVRFCNEVVDFIDIRNGGSI